jgi:hypothetical protein
MAIRKSSPRRHRVDESYPLPEPIEISHEEWWREFDARARELLGIGGEEFIRRFEAGEYLARIEEPDILELAFLRVHPPR